MPTVYGTVEGFREYCDLRGIILPAESIDDDDVSSWLLIASEWLDHGYSDVFPGAKVLGRMQEREWPRRLARDRHGFDISDIIPHEVDYATYEAAAIQAVSPGSLSVNYTPSKYKSLSVDGAVSIEFKDFDSAVEAQTDFLKIRQILAPIFAVQHVPHNASGSSFRV